MALALTGCQSPTAMRWCPLTTQVEPVPHSGVRYLALVNGSGRTLHHCSFTAFLSDDRDPNPLLRPLPFARCSGTRTIWHPGEEARFHCLDSTREFPIVQPLSHIEVVGHSDEGPFRECWRITDSGREELHLPANARFSYVPGMPGSTNFAVIP